MHLTEVFEKSLLLLPKTIPKNKNYRIYLNELFDDYLALLKSVNPKAYKIDGLATEKNFDRIISIQEKFVIGLRNTLDYYLEGKPFKAYSAFSETLNNRRKKYKKILNIREIEAGESFYRIRIKEENFPLDALEMFHIPFESRGKVSTQRYSIPGFPSLYLAKTLYVAWEELNRPGINNFQAVRLQSKDKIKILDLTSSDWGTDHLNKTAYKYLMTWPLTAACSIKVKDYSDTFKPEYIIPQLLLQWIRNDQEVDGIVYSSTHIDSNKLYLDGQLYNLVLPTKETNENGHCSKLKSLFAITSTISNQLIEYSTGGRIFMYTAKEHESIDRKIPPIEIIKGRKFPYSYSTLGHMELLLDGMPAIKLE